MTRRYTQVLVLEAVIISLLVLFGRLFR